jgi:hypothetical protein
MCLISVNYSEENLENMQYILLKLKCKAILTILFIIDWLKLCGNIIINILLLLVFCR